MKNIILATLILLFSSFIFAQDQVIEDFSAIQCDSLINANNNNPNFVILDVRTPGEYNPQHLNGAISRNFYDSDFEAQLELLDKNKTYVIHCRSGSRSGNTLIKMKALGFSKVYNMLGGIISWNANNLPTTDTFAPLFMFVSESFFESDTVRVGETDTTTITITNRANDILKLSDFKINQGDHFTSDIDLTKELLGSEDYSFNIFYTPTLSETVIGDFSIETNGGNGNISINRVGKSTTSVNLVDQKSFIVFPNPASDFIQIEGIKAGRTIQIINVNGQLILENPYHNGLDVSSLEKGLYWIIAVDGQKQFYLELQIQ